MKRRAKIELFGYPGVRSVHGGQFVQAPDKFFILFALLVLEYRGEAPRTLIASRLWEAGTRKQAHVNLRQLLRKVRRLEDQVGASLLDISDAVISRNERTISCDLDSFLAQSHPRTVAELRSLISLYRGRFLDLDVDPATDLSSILEFHRHRMDERFIDMVVEGANRVADEDGLSALRELERRLPHDDRVCRALVTKLARMRGTGAVRQCYNAFCDRLEKELGAAPDEETIDLVQKLWRQPAAVADPIFPDRGIRALAGSVAPRLMVLLPSGGSFQFSPSQLAFVRTLVEDVTFSLCRFRTVATVAPHTAEQLANGDTLGAASEFAVDYVAKTRLRPSDLGDRVAIGVSLIEVSNRQVLWAEEFPFDDKIAVSTHKELATGIAEHLVEVVEFRQIGLARACDNPTAFGRFLIGRHELRHVDLPNIRRARRSLREAVEMVPNFAQAHGWIARSYLMEWILLARSDRELLQEAAVNARRAVDFDPEDGIGYREQGRAAFFQGDWNDGLDNLKMAVHRSPNHADILADYADSLVHASEIEEANTQIKKALSLNPLPPEQYYWTAGAVAFFQGEYSTALETLQRMGNPEPASRLMAACAAMLGDRKLAAGLRHRALAMHPDFNIENWMKLMPQRAPEHRELYMTALRRAGFR